MKKVIVTLLILLLVGCGYKSDDHVDKLLDEVDQVYDTIPESKEAANKISVESYAKIIEYAVIGYEFEHNGELPNSFDDIKNNIDAYSDVKCIVQMGENGSINVCGCKVGNSTRTYYRYNSKDNNGVVVDEVNKIDSNQTDSISGMCN